MIIEDLIKISKNFSDADQKIIAFMLKNKSHLSKYSITQIAKETYTSPASITRLSKKLGFNGFSELKYTLSSMNNLKGEFKNNSWDLLQEDIQNTMNYLRSKDLRPYSQLIKIAHRIFVYGSDWAERNAIEQFIRNFMTCGIYIIDIPSITELRWATENFKSDDLLIVVSFSNLDQELDSLLHKNALNNIPQITITTNNENSLTQHTEYNLHYYGTVLEGLSTDYHAEFNYFTTLHIVLDSVFRNFLDAYHFIDQE